MKCPPVLRQDLFKHSILWCVEFPSLPLPCLCECRMLFPIIIFACSFHGLRLSPASTDQLSVERLGRVPGRSLEFSFCASFSPEELCPVLAPSVFLDSQLYVFDGRFTGCYLGFPSLPHGLGALSRQTLGKSLTFHLVFITWCPLSSKALFHIFCQRFLLSCLEGESNFLLLHRGWK